VAQLTLNYRGSPLSVGRAGKVRGGDRLPWLEVNGTGRDNFETFDGKRWQVQVYGSASDALQHWCTRYGVPLHVFSWREQYASAGVTRDALYLLRPDSYVALAIETTGAAEGRSEEVLSQYFVQRQLQLTAAAPSASHR
jgi:hypothetical protein